MKYARISFPSREVAVRAFHELAQRGRIVSLPDGQFVVPEAAAAFLQTRGLTYQTHEWISEDYVTQALRNRSALNPPVLPAGALAVRN
jgi:hypothetical protein